MAAHTLAWAEKHIVHGGRIILVNDAGMDSLLPDIFSRDVAIYRIDFDTMLEEAPAKIAMLLGHYDEYPITMTAPRSFNISEIGVAVEELLRDETYGRATLECGAGMIVPIQKQPQDPLHFRSDASYLLIGCLGGLGRSLATWMTQRGARNFIFLSRSGDDKEEAAAMVKELRSSPLSINVTVVKGDVSVREDVDQAMRAAVFPVKGIIQAAAVFGSKHFSEMTLQDFNAVLQPKVQGTRNLHEASVDLDLDLDLFVMTSSTIGILGPSTQSHYAAANAYLDAVARHRRKMGLPATSISLGMVKGAGHVHENKIIAGLDVQAAALTTSPRQSNLRMMELACRPPTPGNDADGPELESSGFYDEGVIITGLDPTKVGLENGGGAAVDRGRWPSQPHCRARS